MRTATTTTTAKPITPHPFCRVPARPDTGGPVGAAWSTGAVSSHIHDDRVAWADRVVDHRSDLLKRWPPETLPEPGLRNSVDRWAKGVVEALLPDTSHLPSGGPGGPFTVTAHAVSKGPAPADRTLVTVMTFPDGYRLGSMWPGASGDSSDQWRAWMNGPDGMSVAFTNTGSDPYAGWVLAQRAWTARRWYDFIASAPAGVSLLPVGVSGSSPDAGKQTTYAATKGLMGDDGLRLGVEVKKVAVTALQRAGFWLPDPAQVRWLSSKDAALARIADDGADRPGGERLRAMYESGWKVEVYEAWLREQPSNAPSLHARNFLLVAEEWEEIVTDAYQVMAARATQAGHPAPVLPTNGDGVPQIGEIASLCLQLGLRPLTIGVMVADGTFEVDALRTLAALRDRTPQDA